jgi:lysophospholipase L1-like esterase
VDAAPAACDDRGAADQEGTMKARLALAAAVALAALVAVPTALAQQARVGFPSSIASTGDSITRAFNTGPIPFLDAPQNSWSTGTNATVNSHFTRIRAANPAARAFNDAVTGADMADLGGQVQRAIAQGAEYVTILLGANDACASSEAAMTPVATFGAQFAGAMATLSAGLPDARVFVASVPDVYNLWAIYRTSFAAQLVWSIGGICQSLLARPGSTSAADNARRLRVRQRVIDYNAQLAQVCAAYVHCRYDGNAVFSTPFVRSDVTTRDYFHPSIAGLTKLAAATWSATFDFGDTAAPVSTAAVGGGTVALSATDNVAVAGIEYRLGGGWTRYTAPVALAPGTTLTYRAVDVNGNVEAAKTATG